MAVLMIENNCDSRIGRREWDSSSRIGLKSSDDRNNTPPSKNRS